MHFRAYSVQFLFVVEYSFNKTFLVSALITTIPFCLIRQTLHRLQMKQYREPFRVVFCQSPSPLSCCVFGCILSLNFVSFGELDLFRIVYISSTALIFPLAPPETKYKLMIQTQQNKSHATCFFSKILHCHCLLYCMQVLVSSVVKGT